MSNEMKSATPLINPDAYPQMLEMFQQQAERHRSELDKVLDLLDAIGEGEGPDLEGHEDRVCEALNLLVADHERAIENLEVGIAELEGVLQ